MERNIWALRIQRGAALGFTLIELLVVVAVLAVLAALLFPVVAAVKERARLTVCGSNLRGLGNAARLYADDYDDRWFVAPTLYNPHRELMSALAPYVGDPGIFYCPSARSVGNAAIEDTPANRAAGNISFLYFSYARDTSPGRPQWLPETHLLAPSDPPRRWLMTDWFEREGPSAHRLGNKTIQILRIDGGVSLILQNPRSIFEAGES